MSDADSTTGAAGGLMALLTALSKVLERFTDVAAGAAGKNVKDVEAAFSRIRALEDSNGELESRLSALEAGRVKHGATSGG